MYGSISGYGDVGPASARGGFDLILQAESGLMSVTGSESSGPVKVGAPVLDVGAALLLFVRAPGRTRRTRAHGVGTHVSSSLLEFALASLGSLAASTFVSGEAPGLLGTHSPTFAPYGGFRTADGWIVVAEPGPRTCGSAAARCSEPTTSWTTRDSPTTPLGCGTVTS